jgi:hypothetical protein
VFLFGDQIIPLDLFGFGDLEYDLDTSFTKMPNVTNDSIDLFYNANLYVLNEEQFARAPKTPLKFINDDSLAL